jgi:hypothetical protein
MQTRAVAGGDRSVAKTVAIAQQKKRFGAKILERKRAALCELVLGWKRREKAFGEKRE